MPHPDAQAAETPEELCKIRLQVRKEGRVRFVGHLDFMALFQRAARRAELPVRFSGGFHPAPQISFPDALPTGIESDAEIIDVRLYRPCDPDVMMAALNTQLPVGVEVLAAQIVPWKAPAPSVAIQSSVYRVPLPAGRWDALAARVEVFLALDELYVARLKKGQEQNFDLRPAVQDVRLEDGTLWLTLVKGSPLPVLGWLLELPPDEATKLTIRKVAVTGDW